MRRLRSWGGLVATRPVHSRRALPAIMGVRLIRLRHLVCILAALDRGAGAVGRVAQFSRQLLTHGLSGTGARGANQPAHGQGHPPIPADLHRHLIGRTTDAPRLHLQGRGSVPHGQIEGVHGRAARLLLNLVHRSVEKSLRDGLFAALHQTVNELRDCLTSIARIRIQHPPAYASPSWHRGLLATFLQSRSAGAPPAWTIPNKPACTARGTVEEDRALPAPSQCLWAHDQHIVPSRKAERLYGRTMNLVLALLSRRRRAGFRPLGAVLRAPLLPVLDSRGIERSADNMVTNARKILYATAADQHYRVLLQVVALARNIRRHFVAIAQTHPRDFAQGTVRLLRGHSLDLRANPTLLRRSLKTERLLLE